MFRYKLMQFLYGRYGNDNLNMFLIVLLLIFAVINLFVHSAILYLLQTACFVLYFIRFFSNNREARSRENEKFMKIYSKFRKSKNPYDFNTVNYNDYTASKKAKKDPGYKYFKCPNCSVKLRVPKKKGKITITCPKCRASFKGKS